MADLIARDLVVHGGVQGVFFRAFVEASAEANGVAGWAENRHDGTVAIRLEGEPGPVGMVERACAQGSSRARVDRIDGCDVPVAGLTSFRVG